MTSSPIWQITESLTGKTITQDITTKDGLDDVKAKIFEKTGTPMDKQRLVYVGRHLEDVGMSSNRMEPTIHLMLSLLGGGPKRPREDKSDTKNTKPLKVAAAKSDAAEYLKKNVTEATAVAMMRSARDFMAGPPTAAQLCQNLTADQVATIRQWMADETKRNGPIFYSRLLQFFAEGYRAFRNTHDQLTAARIALERALAYRPLCLFMTLDGKMTRDGIVEALDQHEEALKRQAQHQADAHARQQDVQNAIHNPEVIAALLRAPHVQQILAQMMNPGGNGGDADMR